MPHSIFGEYDLKRTADEKMALATARQRIRKRVVAIISIFIGGIGIVGLKIGGSELWREHLLRTGALSATATAVEWQRVQGKSSTSCSVSYQFTTRSGSVVLSHNDIGADFWNPAGMASFPCGGAYGSKSIPVLYSEADPQINRPLEQPALKHGVVFCLIGVFLLIIAYLAVRNQAPHSKPRS
jgi:hypothetical protein